SIDQQAKHLVGTENVERRVLQMIEFGPDGLPSAADRQEMIDNGGQAIRLRADNHAKVIAIAAVTSAEQVPDQKPPQRMRRLDRCQLIPGTQEDALVKACDFPRVTASDCLRAI